MIDWNPMQWFASHWMELVGWGVVVAFLRKAYVVVNRVVKYGESIDSAKDDLQLIKTNHLAHIQIELESVNENLQGMREDFKDLRDDFRVVLARI